MREKGFTLIEMLVVITIIGLLAVFLLPNVLGARESANQAADKKNLSEIYTFLQLYRDKKGHPPSHGGHRMLLAPWVEHIIDRTELNRDRYFTGGKAGDDSYYRDEVKPRPLRELWNRFEDLSSSDTHYAGLAKTHSRAFSKPGTPLAATDNEGITIWNDGTIHVLMSDATVKSLLKSDLIEQGLWPADDPADFIFPVGPESPHELLKMLEK
jgi:prepilin-type N-terminal cleavage/methylation domain-containing protein